MSSLDGGSAAPPTADVPTCGSRLVLSPDDPFPTFQECGAPAGHRGPHDSGSCSWTVFDRSGVAGEPEATTKESCSCGDPWTDHGSGGCEACLPCIAKPPQIDAPGSPTQDPAPTPETPGAVNMAGGVAVPDEAVEAGARADHAFGRLGDDPEWDGLTDTDRDSYRRAARAYLAAAAPLIVEQYLRHRIRSAEVEQTPEEVWEQVRQMARHAAVRTTVVDALRSAAGKIRTELVCCDAYDWAHGDGPLIARVENGGHGICFWGEAAARINEARADELERGGDR